MERCGKDNRKQGVMADIEGIVLKEDLCGEKRGKLYQSEVQQGPASYLLLAGPLGWECRTLADRLDVLAAIQTSISKRN